MAERLACFRAHHDRFRSAVVNEPRGSNALVGALLCEPADASCAAGVIFFNNVGYLGMCGHGTMGLGVTLGYLGRIAPGRHRIETPVGVVEIELHAGGAVTVENVASYRWAKDVEVEVDGVGRVMGDVAWGGNWFFITGNAPCELELANLDRLIDYTWRVRQALERNGVTGANGGEIDHIELSGAPRSAVADSRNFVLCPGKEYDRCRVGPARARRWRVCRGTGNLARAACGARRASSGRCSKRRFALREGKVYPRVKGSAFITADTNLVLQDDDPFCWGIRV